MSESLNSSSWYRVASLRPALRPHAKIHRHSFRGQRWYVIQDQASGKHHRFTPETHLVLSLMDGERTVEEIWNLASERLGDDGLTQDEVLRLLAQLHQSDILQGDGSPDMREMSARSEKQASRKFLQSVMNPLAIRLPLFDPDRFLTATMPLVRPLFSWFGVLLFTVVTVLALILSVMHWNALTENIADRVLATESLLLLLVTYPFIKALHELGHGYAAKVRGGEVHEVGLMFLVFIPVPYVDASAATSFSSKWQRALVGSAGMLVEVFLAAMALFVWLNVEPGLLKAFCFNIMVIGGVSTVLFNGNPLLRFDGYYVLADLVEIPNLAMRSNRYLGYLVQRYLFGVAGAESPVTAEGEARWFVFYGVAAYCYRVFITLTIILFVASEFFIIGIILGIWAGVMMFLWPIVKSFGFLFTSPVLREQRLRSVAVTGGCIAVVACALSLIPVPLATTTQGVVWSGEDSVVHAGTDGVVEELLVAPDALVERGQPLLRMKDPLLPARVRVVEAELEELRLRHSALLVLDRAEARVIAEKIRHSEAELSLNRNRETEMLVRSPGRGRVVLATPQDLVGKFFRKGEAIGMVAQLDAPTVRALVRQGAIDLVRERTREVHVRFAERFGDVRVARIVHEIPVVTDKLPSAAFSTAGGGPFAVDPGDPSGSTSLELLYQLELEVLSPRPAAGIGSRVFVRFGHGTEPLASQAYRQLRLLFLRHFNV